MLNVILCILGVLGAIACTILVFIYILPEKRKNSLPKFLQIVRRILNMDDLLIEKILKALYIFSTLFCIIGGFFMLFNFSSNIYGQLTWYGWRGFLMIIIGPIAIRLAYEALMMFIPSYSA